jgi:4-hydroxy-tetrahydrodipicolinate synthase
MHDLCEAALRKDHVLAEKINNSLKLLHTQLFLEANPIPVKWALHEMGMIPSGIRLPLVSLDTKFHTEVREAMHTAGIKKLVEMR